MFSFGPQITYEHPMGYLYLAEEFVVCTAELVVNPLLNLDSGGKKRLIGIEFFNEEANRLRHLAGQKHVFRLVRDGDQEYFSFRVSDENCKSSYQLNQAVTFHFCKPNYKGFLGIDIYRTKDYWAELLTGRADHGEYGFQDGGFGDRDKSRF